VSVANGEGTEQMYSKQLSV